ncbi:hypothetical protein LSCM1_07900 [Leishmania martiniquensis]|uniref:RING-type domain-containing protein n=1 Tax=Leishmania martiniquensis TaxID=1580590 RepID=A0A836H4A6_9TRYP|nr:hypothetical protein LSCM1_07900 [Leishmania martiniquensis]
MQPALHAPPSSKRTLFNRMMAARRTGGVDPGTAGGIRIIENSRSCPPLPVIRPPQDTATSSPVVSSVSHSSAARHSSDVAVPQRPKKASSSAPYVITDKTPRAELLAIIVQLQEELTQRTDSVNAIQRNFERLSSMHYAEQLELQRLRLGEKARLQAKPDCSDAALRQRERALAEMGQSVGEQQGKIAQLEEQLAASRSSCELQKLVMQLIASHAEGFREVLHEEAAAFLQLHTSSVIERAAIGAQHAGAQQQLLCKGVAQLLADHHAQMVPHSMRGVAADTWRQLEEPGKASATTILELVRQCLCETAEAVRHHAAAAHAADLQRALAEVLSQRQQEEGQRAVRETLCLRLLATEEEERRVRRELLYGELQARAAAEQAFDEVRLLRERAESAAAATHLLREATTALLTCRVSEWCAAAEGRLVDFERSVESFVKETSWVLDKQWQEALLGEHRQLQSLYETQVQAMHAEWRGQIEVIQRTYAMQLAQARSDLSAQMQTAEDRRAAAERLSRTMEDALIQLKCENAAEVRAVEAHWQSALSDALRDCEQRWTTMLEECQERLSACSRAMLHLLLNQLRIRSRCVYQEQEERAALCRLHGRQEARQLRDEQAATTQHRVIAAVLLERAEHQTQDEAASRALLCASASADWAALVERERAHKAQVHHALSLAAAASRLEEVRAEAAGCDDKWRECADQLQENLREEEQARLAAVARASDATLAVQEAHAALERLSQDFAEYRCSVNAAAQRIELAESATESTCSCTLCLRLYCQPLACVPCGHIYCAQCLLRHPRNRSLCSITSSLTSAVSASGGESGAADARGGIEVAQWLHSKSDPHASLFCPECASASVRTVVELRALGELAAKYDYKKRSLALLLAGLR